MLTIQQLAEQSNVAPHVVRYYARIGLIKPYETQENGYRLFSLQDAKGLRFIRMAKHLGFTLAEIKLITRHAEANHSPCDDVRRIIQSRIEENRQKIEDMIQLQSRMEHALETWKDMPNGTPDGHSICHLIESVEPN